MIYNFFTFFSTLRRSTPITITKRRENGEKKLWRINRKIIMMTFLWNRLNECNPFCRLYCAAFRLYQYHHPARKTRGLWKNGAEIWLTWRNIYELMTTLCSHENVSTPNEMWKYNAHLHTDIMTFPFIFAVNNNNKKYRITKKKKENH